MSVRFNGGRIELTGNCPLEDVEALQPLLIEHPGATVEVAACTGLHTAVAQLILAARAPVAGIPRDPFLQTRLLPAFRRASD